MNGMDTVNDTTRKLYIGKVHLLSQEKDIVKDILIDA